MFFISKNAFNKAVEEKSFEIVKEHDKAEHEWRVREEFEKRLARIEKKLNIESEVI